LNQNYMIWCTNRSRWVALYHQRIQQNQCHFLFVVEGTYHFALSRTQIFCWEAWVLAINFLISQNHMIEFMKSNYYDPYIAQYIHPKKAYKVKLKDAERFHF
jgi:hypothetical protein